MTTLNMTHTQIADALHTWAKGSLPCQAAVQFLLAIDTLYPGHPMLRISDDSGHLVVYPDVFDLDDQTWADRLGGMSSGERAGWILIRSILDGELNDTFWRLDTNRSGLLLAALGMNHY